MDVQTYFFRRTNMNALGQPRSWTDHLLWHHAAHTVDLFQYQTGGEIVAANAIQGPMHPELGIAMDMSIQLKAATGAICTLSLSFNNDGPLGTFFRYIGDTGTYIARYDDLSTARTSDRRQSKVDVSMNGIELQDREFFAAIREGREPNASVAQVLPCYQVLDQLERQLFLTEEVPGTFRNPVRALGEHFAVARRARVVGTHQLEDVDELLAGVVVGLHPVEQLGERGVVIVVGQPGAQPSLAATTRVRSVSGIRDEQCQRFFVLAAGDQQLGESDDRVLVGRVDLQCRPQAALVADRDHRGEHAVASVGSSHSTNWRTSCSGRAPMKPSTT